MPDIQIAMTEVNSAVDTDTQPDALFSADTYPAALASGVFTVDWWDTHNGAHRDQHRAGRGDRLRRLGHPVQRTCVGSTLRTPDPIDGWTLAFSFPAALEPVSSAWNGTWTENGQAVTVTSLSWGGTLAADGGNTVDIGFVGANDGAYPPPAAVTLNGTVCTTTYSS